MKLQQHVFQNGIIAVDLVRIELIRRGCFAQKLEIPCGADEGVLVVISQKSKCIVRVKSSLLWDAPSFGYATSFLSHGRPFFDWSSETVIADTLVTVSGRIDQPIFHVFSVDAAEVLAQEMALRLHSDYLSAGETDLTTFPVRFSAGDPRLEPYLNHWGALSCLAP